VPSFSTVLSVGLQVKKLREDWQKMKAQCKGGAQGQNVESSLKKLKGEVEDMQRTASAMFEHARVSPPWSTLESSVLPGPSLPTAW